MILGDTCTRACAFCNVKTGAPLAVDPQEPGHLAEVVATMGLAHVVSPRSTATICRTAVPSSSCAASRPSGPSSPTTTIEILTPDFLSKPGALEAVVQARPDVYNHNLETVPRLYRTVRPGARYFHSLRLLQQVKELDPTLFTKSGIMVGLGEEKREVLQVMDDMRSADIDFLTIGQYLRPTPRHHKVERFVEPDEFAGYARMARAKGFHMVAASPLTRSSYHAGAISSACARRAAPSTAAPPRGPEISMPTHAEKRVLPYSPEQLYELVAGVDRYPEFLPWCKAARITSREGDVFFADLVIAFKVFRERFSSKVTLHPQIKIDVEYINGPFRYLKNHWQFVPHPDGCLIDFYVDFEFKSKILQNLIGLLFNEAVRRMVAAFEARARQLYTPVGRAA